MTIPISIERQRAQTRVGHIRIGDQVANASGNGTHPVGIDKFRFTSPDKSAVEALAKEYGGKVKQWEGNPGEWELHSTVNQIRVIIDTKQSCDENFTQYDGKTRSHFCDGELCKYIEIKRDKPKNGKIIFCEDRGIVPCLCDPDGIGADVEKRACDLSTTLRVILPCTKDITLWQLTSKGVIFNKEVNGMIETLKGMGLRHAYCLLTIHKMSKTVGNEVSKWVVARLTLDADPPEFVKALMENTLEGQAKRLALDAPAPGPQAMAGNTAKMLPPATNGNRELTENQKLFSEAMKELGFLANTQDNQAGMKAFKDACEKANKDFTVEFLRAKDERCHDWPSFIEFVRPTAETKSEVAPEQPDIFAENT